MNVCSFLVLHFRAASHKSRCDVPWDTGRGHLCHCGLVLTQKIITFFVLTADLPKWRQKGKERFEMGKRFYLFVFSKRKWEGEGKWGDA